jgi:hypothetical protein
VNAHLYCCICHRVFRADISVPGLTIRSANVTGNVQCADCVAARERSRLAYRSMVAGVAAGDPASVALFDQLKQEAVTWAQRHC